MNLLIVESPAKAKTINKYLGSDFKVLASYGHIRDLPSKNGSVVPDDNFKMIYEIGKDSEKHIKPIVEAAKNASAIYLATDPDREGESISWHIVEVLKHKKAIKKDVPVKRVVFNEITKKAVQKAVENPREIDENLVNAQQARRALDYLVGFQISPILWRKLPGSKSAGRVQSVALKLICERETEIEKFKSQEYFSVQGLFLNSNKTLIETTLFRIKEEKLDRLSLNDRNYVEKIVSDAKNYDFYVSSIEKRQLTRNPQPPFTTSSLQQEASRKLGFSAKMTMQIAQKLYEGINIGGETIGLITYMRTDGVQVSEEALNATRNYINRKFGEKYLPGKPRIYQSKAKNAQEAHEAIRPTNVDLHPEQVKEYLDDRQFQLYELIWKRLVASQMESVILDSMTVIIEDQKKNYSFKVTGSTIKFDGFYKLYKEGNDDNNEEDENKLLPPLNLNEKLITEDIQYKQHFTEPPPRYSEASLVKKLEELGIGRPSTYASIISVLQDREYVKFDKKRFIPEDRGMLVTAFLENFFNQYVKYDFTANLEEQLDEISDGKRKWKNVLQDFWVDFFENVQHVTKKPLEEVMESIDKLLEHHIFPAQEGIDVRKCPTCSEGKLELKIGRYGAFIGCNKYPACDYRRPLGSINEKKDQDENQEPSNFPRVIGIDDSTNLRIILKNGPYGAYLQLGEVGDENVKSPKRIALPNGVTIDNLTLDTAKFLVSLPKEIGKHSSNNEPLVLGIGKFGPYVLYQGKFYSINKYYNFLALTVEQAEEIIAKKDSGGSSKRGRATSTTKAKAAPKEKSPAANSIVIDGYEVKKGAFGILYVEVAGTKYKFPKGTKLEEVDEKLLNKILSSK